MRFLLSRHRPTADGTFMLASLVLVVVRVCCRHAWIVMILALVLGAGGAAYTAAHFRMDTNSENLVSPQAPWRQEVLRYDAAFPHQNNLIAVVVDGVTAERADEAARLLAAALAENRTLFTSVRRPDGGPFLERHGLLLLPLADVQKTTEQLIEAQPLLGVLAADPSLRGIMTALATMLEGVEHGQIQLQELDAPIKAFADTFQAVVDGKPAYFSWTALIGEPQAGPPPTRRFIEIQPRLDYDALMPGEAASAAIRAAAEKLGLTPQAGVHVRLTGPVPMADEEFATIAENGGLLATFMIVAVLAMLWLAVRSVRMIVAILVTLIIGLVATSALGLAIYGAFNVISVAFIVLFVGLGVDFGIQVCVRYRAERHRRDELRAALVQAGAGIGGGLTLAALAVAAAFYSFLPTDYAGLAQLGMIAGSGMIVTYVLSITALPALLALLRPRGEAEEPGFRRLAPLDQALARRARWVLGVATALGLACLALMPLLRFDSNPLNLRSRHSEAVATALDLMQNPQTSPNFVNVLRPSHAAAKELADRLSKLPEVAHVLTIDTFVPDQQKEKLALLADAAGLLETVFNPLVRPRPPTRDDIASSFEATATALKDAAGSGTADQAAQARRLAALLERLATAGPADWTSAEKAFLPSLKTMLDQLRAALHPEPITLDTLPPDFKRDWIAAGGLYRLQVFPSGDTLGNEALNRFTSAVLLVAPDATGTPIIIEESGKVIVSAFLKAGALSLVLIAVILGVALRRVGDVLVALAPLLLAGILTLASCVLLGIALNLANIIALPLLFGVGVAFDIYFVMAWRNGQRKLLRSPLTRAVITSAGTTAAAFGTLSFSSHPGTASMGVILLVSLFWILAAMLVVLPALLNVARGRAGAVPGG
ncbi:MMPL family transporter [Vineibacter terrae]|nr:MMPL family transporter [Vineibacter terrae]